MVRFEKGEGVKKADTVNLMKVGGKVGSGCKGVNNAISV